MQYVIITNNPLVRESYEGKLEIDFVDSYGYYEVLDRIKNLVHQSWVLETHPLSGSIKPNETPYKTVILSKPKHKALDFQSLQIVEKSLETYHKFATTRELPQWGQKTLEDFQLIDKTLIDSAVSQMFPSGTI